MAFMVLKRVSVSARKSITLNSYSENHTGNSNTSRCLPNIVPTATGSERAIATSYHRPYINLTVTLCAPCRSTYP